jgi:hypothetical protein
VLHLVNSNYFYVNKLPLILKQYNNKIHSTIGHIHSKLFDKESIPKYSSEVFIIFNIEPPYLKLNDSTKIYYRYVKLTVAQIYQNHPLVEKY